MLVEVVLKLAALSDDSDAVVLKVYDAVGAALDELHFSMKAFGNSIVSGEAPHTGDGLRPGA